MAQLVLSTIGAAVGARIAPRAFRAVGQALGRALGSAAGARIDDAIFGDQRSYSGPRLTDLYLQSSAEGAPIPWLAGRLRIAGQVIWAARFKETVETEESRGGGKGGGPSVRTTRYRYTLSFAVGLCEGPIASVARIWANGAELDLSALNWRLHRGEPNQAPDPLIEAIEGAGSAPAYRDLAYIVFEDFPLDDYGATAPHISAEVIAGVPGATRPRLETLARGVCLIPGAGEFVYATTPVRRALPDGRTIAENAHAQAERADFEHAIDQLQAEMPGVQSVLLVVSWFGLDLRMAQCAIKPGVETHVKTTTPMAWRVAGVTRANAHLISQVGGGPAFGGTPDDASVIAAIRSLKARGYKVGLYPFILMDVPPGSAKPDPAGGPEQPAFPWRGRITLNTAPGRPGTTDKTPAATTEVAGFFGTAAPAHFTANAQEQIVYSGPAEWSFRRFILHYAKLAQTAGGVDSFIMGSELRGVTGVRSAPAAFPAVDALQALAQDVRTIIGAGPVLTYAADWSEYAGIRPQDGSGDVFFHLDPLWADPAISCVGVDWYPPLTDWRDDGGGLDGQIASAIHDPAYLEGRIEAGENYDWFYASPEARAAQQRTPIADAAQAKHWVFRAKDLKAFWLNPHHNRLAGVEAAAPTPWVPQSKPIWLVELGCPAVDKGANSPNLFIDPKSAESALPPFSNGARDDLIQRRVLEAYLSYWRAPGPNNPVSALYLGPMIEPFGVHLWCWDARPYPAFPARADVWADAPAWERGHWLNGRAGAADLASVIEALCRRAGLAAVEVSAAAGLVGGLALDGPAETRAVLEPLMRVHALSARARNGVLRFEAASEHPVRTLTEDIQVLAGQGEALTAERADEHEAPLELRLRYLDAARDYRVAEAVAQTPDLTGAQVVSLDAPFVLGATEAQQAAEWLLREARAAHRPLQTAVAWRCLELEPGDIVETSEGPAPGRYRIRAIKDAASRELDLAPAPPRPRIQPIAAAPSSAAPHPPSPQVVALDLPPLAGAEDDVRPLAAVWTAPWTRPVDLFLGQDAATARYVGRADAPAASGALIWALWPGPVGRWDEGNRVRVQLPNAGLASRDKRAVLDGANAFAVQAPDGVWEVFQARHATLVAPDVYELSGLLRSPIGRRPDPSAPIPAGASIVVLDRRLARIAVEPRDLDAAQTLFAVPAGRAASHPSATKIPFLWRAAAETPFAPVHVRSRLLPGGDRIITWVRCARRGGDPWFVAEPPQEPEGERYRLVFLANGQVARSVHTTAPEYVYPAGAWATELAGQAPKVRVAQLGAGGRIGWETESAI